MWHKSDGQGPVARKVDSDIYLIWILLTATEGHQGILNSGFTIRVLQVSEPVYITIRWIAHFTFRTTNPRCAGRSIIGEKQIHIRVLPHIISFEIEI